MRRLADHLASALERVPHTSRMMRIVLEITSESGAGRKVLLAADQEVRVGRTEWADFSVSGDGHMSSVHFSLQTDQQACYVQDLGSSNGTKLNGQPVQDRIAVQDGDRISAGQTQFAVHVEGTDLEVVAAHLEQRAAHTPTPEATAAATAASSAAGEATYTKESCDSGLMLYRGEVDQIPPHSVAVLLAKTYRPYLIVDFNKLQIPLPDTIDEPDYLFDWFDSAAAAVASPVVLAQEDSDQWPELIEQGWGNDAVIVLFSLRDKPALLEHLRRSTRGKENAQGKRGAVLGYCWPSVMAPLLAHYPAESVQRLLDGIEAVLVELPDLPITWQVYGGNQLAAALDQLGFTQQATPQGPPEEEAPETELDTQE